MKGWFTDASIRWKLTVLMAGTTVLALGLAALGLGTYEVVTFRRALEQKLTVVAEIVGRNSTAALEFGDRSVATDVLTALEAEPSIEAAVIFDKDGKPFARYGAGRTKPVLPDSPGEPGNRVSGNRFIVVRQAVLEGEVVGTVYVQSNLNELTSRMLVFGGITMMIVVACAVIALFVSAGLQGRISRPILDLANTARLVTSDRNFSLRANTAGADEVGLLVQDFNRERRAGQARAEREFAASRLTDAERELRAAEDAVRSFQSRNRDFRSSPFLQLDLERLQREVTRRQMVYNGLSQSFEQARLEEVRNTPVIAMVELPELPARPRPRGALLSALVAFLAVVAVLFAWYFVREVVRPRWRQRLMAIPETASGQ